MSVTACTSRIPPPTEAAWLCATTGKNTIGGTTAAARNVISGNGLNGIAIIGAKEVGNLVLGNYIGTNIYGQMDVGVDLGNTLDGVRISRVDAGGSTASGNRIGGITAEERNVISGNHQDGVSIIGDSGPDGNLVQGNYIGTDSSGTGGIKNDRSGVRLYSGDFTGQRLEQHHRRDGDRGGQPHLGQRGKRRGHPGGGHRRDG